MCESRRVRGNLKPERCASLGKFLPQSRPFESPQGAVVHNKFCKKEGILSLISSSIICIYFDIRQRKVFVVVSTKSQLCASSMRIHRRTLTRKLCINSRVVRQYFFLKSNYARSHINMFN